MKVFIIILNWNRHDDTIECLRSIGKLKVKNYELKVVVVDNGSSDNSIKKISHYLSATDYQLLINKSNLGFAAGNNVGIKYSIKNGADYIMILNNDTRVDPGLLNSFISTANKYPDFGAASPKIYFERGYEFHKDKYRKKDLGRVVWYAGGMIDWNNVYGSPRGVDEVDSGRFNDVQETDFVTGTCMFISKIALKRVGFFNEDYYMYYEDTELSLRIKRAGFKIYYVPTAIVWHKVAQSSRIGGDLNDYFITRNRLMFGMRYSRFRTRLSLSKEALRMIWSGRGWQRRGVLDYYLGILGRGSWKN